MAKYTITCKCGHEMTKKLFGKTADRERKIVWMEQNMLCPDCYKKQQNSLPLVAEKEICIVNKDGRFFVIKQGNSYAVKETLKEKGFFFGEYFPKDSQSMIPKKGWMIQDSEESTKILEELNIKIA